MVHCVTAKLAGQRWRARTDPPAGQRRMLLLRIRGAQALVCGVAVMSMKWTYRLGRGELDIPTGYAFCLRYSPASFAGRATIDKLKVTFLAVALSPPEGAAKQLCDVLRECY